MNSSSSCIRLPLPGLERIAVMQQDYLIYGYGESVELRTGWENAQKFHTAGASRVGKLRSCERRINLGARSEAWERTRPARPYLRGLPGRLLLFAWLGGPNDTAPGLSSAKASIRDLMYSQFRSLAGTIC